MAGRPREFDRNQALRQALELFWARGFETTSMADLVAALGIASARIYAAFGSKEALFREAIELYESHEGGFADRALAEEPSARAAIARLLEEAVQLYTRPGQPLGCMVVSSAVNCSSDNDGVRQWLAEHRLARTASIVQRLQAAVQSGELAGHGDATSLGDYYSTVLHGLSVQARDGASAEQLRKVVALAMGVLDTACNVTPD
ncbi:TetR/AcrR family transcriptional regulator [Pseudomonas sessilinigenes]|uniref:TetR/AcrR family transcriptional regulator n=1 Tax=Pseudomonas sessilinigenes TaxID=658629 RepID=A0ABX8ML39_9PSED|nr:TetR/AcrR family transcriptional regulator [Pseudomonas sessilinigenes]AZC27141.1 Transcriptional regulator, AcrR family [Pseudomonas sessilinigenes]QXH38919.1 TetR/AcrR family transcriptional regulator [Pseudomonas sessilinigenes]